MRYGYVTTNVLDMWAEPKYNCERVNQALFGDAVRYATGKAGYVRATLADGYSGWIDNRFVADVTRKKYDSYLKNRNGIIAASKAVLCLKPESHSVAPHSLFYSTRVWKKSESKGFARIMTPDGSAYYVPSGKVWKFSGVRKPAVTGGVLVRECRKFLGVPYLWGGITPAGFDCSGLIRAVCRRFGISLPRDTKDQIKAGHRVDPEEIKTGDLLFFNRHVGFAVGAGRLIHSSVGGGGVRVDSLRPDLPDYREDLHREFKEARRII